ncbi:MAG: transglutaminase domain-containing protein [Spirochaetia bacterium]|jgi:hypothetical protein|nr:transglutaminase domain-containing protein [Spirochaetia bacterium]
MDPRVRRLPIELTERVFTDPEAALPEVAARLTSGTADQFYKAKIIHDWICDNIAYDAESYFSGKIKPQDYKSVLKNKIAVCAGYSELFLQMCTLAGVEAIVISGYSKGFGYRGNMSRESDHAWNAVNINKKWYLFDVTWDAGYLDRKSYIKNYSTEYLFPDSRAFLYSHLPEKKEHQYYAPALSAEDFQKEPYIRWRFFQYGLGLKSDNLKYSNVIDDTFSFEITVNNPGVLLSNSLRTLQQSEVRGASWQERKGAAITFFYDVPDTGEYEGMVFARWRSEINFQDRVDTGTFENKWLPSADLLLEEKKISRAERDIFDKAYFKVPENNMYYFAEDQFDLPKNNAVLKIHRTAVI